MRTYDDLVKLERHLRTCPIEAVIPLPVGTHHGAQRFSVHLEGGFFMFAKPHDAMPDGERAVRNEVAAWSVARELGWADMTSPTVLREMVSPFTGRRVLVALQWKWPGAREDVWPGWTEDDLWRAAIFDALILNTDREAHNWLEVVQEGCPRLKLIDHGLAFDWPGRRLASIFYEQRVHETLPGWARRDLGELPAKAAQSDLLALLTRAQYESLVNRVETIGSRGALSI